MATKKNTYKKCLTVFLHRQFWRTVRLTLAICYVCALWQGQLTSWSYVWFSASVRTLLLFIGALFIMCLCLAQAHSGERTSRSALHTCTEYLYDWSTVNTLICYSASAIWFTTVYIWSQPSGSNLGIVDPGKIHERPRMNERPLFLYTMFLHLAIAQAAVHVCRDYGRRHFSLNDPAAPAAAAYRPRRLILKDALLPMLHDTITRVGLGLIIGNANYFFLLRKLVWKTGYLPARMRDSTIIAYRPRPGFNPFELTVRLGVEGFMMIYMWEFVRTALGIYMSTEPVNESKDHKLAPLTNDSTAPNTILVQGLCAKKDLNRAYAFLELAVICQRFPDRRKAIYSDIDNGTFKKVLQECLTEITAVKKRIDETNASTTLPPISSEMEIRQHLLRDGSRNSPLLRARHSPDLSHALGSSRGPNPLRPTIQQGTSQLKILPASVVQGSLQQLLRSPFGEPFRQTFARRAAAIALGAPHSQAATVVNAVTALTQLALHSKTEDVFGVVNRSVLEILRKFADVLVAIHGFVMSSLDVHWTDVEYDATESRRYKNLGELGGVVRALKTGLEMVFEGFKLYSKALGMTRNEIEYIQGLLREIKVGDDDQ